MCIRDRLIEIGDDESHCQQQKAQVCNQDGTRTEGVVEAHRDAGRDQSDQWLSPDRTVTVGTAQRQPTPCMAASGARAGEWPQFAIVGQPVDGEVVRSKARQQTKCSDDEWYHRRSKLVA